MNNRAAVTALSVALSFAASGQNVTRDSAGNFTEIAHDSTTAFTLTTTYNLSGKSETLPVYESRTGKLYVWRTNKKGKKYRFYLHTEAEKP